jgi:hypothetical protein
MPRLNLPPGSLFLHAATVLHGKNLAILIFLRCAGAFLPLRGNTEYIVAASSPAVTVRLQFWFMDISS